MVQNSSSEQRCSECFDVCNKEHPEIGDLVGSGQVSEQSRLLDKNLVGLGLTWCQEFSGGSAMATVNAALRNEVWSVASNVRSLRVDSGAAKAQLGCGIL